MNLYYECEGMLYDEWGLYWVQHNVGILDGREVQYNRAAMMHATRVWREDDTGVMYYKNKMEDLKETFGECDMDEFLWIKLKAKSL